MNLFDSSQPQQGGDGGRGDHDDGERGAASGEDAGGRHPGWAGPAREVVSGGERGGGRQRDQQNRGGAGEEPLCRGRDGDAVPQQRSGDPERVGHRGQGRDSEQRHQRSPPAGSSAPAARAATARRGRRASQPGRPSQPGRAIARPLSAASTGSPAGKNGVSATAVAAPENAAARVRRSASVGSASASSTAGNVASRPNAAVFVTVEPASTPSSTATFQTMNSVTPQVQNADRRRAGSSCRSANATDSSVVICAPSSRIHQWPAVTSARATPTAANWAPPAKTSSDMITGTHHGRPPATAIAPNETPTIPSARQTRATSRSSADSVVRQDIRMFTIMNTVDGVRQTEQLEVWSEHVGGNGYGGGRRRLDRGVAAP